MACQGKKKREWKGVSQPWRRNEQIWSKGSRMPFNYIFLCTQHNIQHTLLFDWIDWLVWLLFVLCPCCPCCVMLCCVVLHCFVLILRFLFCLGTFAVIEYHSSVCCVFVCLLFVFCVCMSEIEVHCAEMREWCPRHTIGCFPQLHKHTSVGQDEAIVSHFSPR